MASAKAHRLPEFGGVAAAWSGDMAMACSRAGVLGVDGLKALRCRAKLRPARPALPGSAAGLRVRTGFMAERKIDMEEA